MVSPKTVLLLLAGFTVTVFLVSWGFGVISPYSFGWAFGLGITIMGCLIYLEVMNRKMASASENKRGFEYCWRRTNELLSTMDNADHLEWRGGFDRKSILKAFSVGGKEKHYRALYGGLVSNKQLVVVIYCVEDDDIVSYIANPSPSLISDPFADFKPSGSSGSRGMMPYYDNKRRRMRYGAPPGSYGGYGGYDDGGSGGGGAPFEGGDPVTKAFKINREDVD